MFSATKANVRTAIAARDQGLVEFKHSCVAWPGHHAKRVGLRVAPAGVFDVDSHMEDAVNVHAGALPVVRVAADLVNSNAAPK